jgi:hypothetical protein
MKATLLLAILVFPCLAADPWTTPVSGWTEADAQRVLKASPWARLVSPAKVTVRWESARPIRFAWQRLRHQPLVPDGQACYALSVAGIHADSSGHKPQGSLRASGRQAVPAFEVRIQDELVMFLFPRVEQLRDPVVFRFPFGLKIRDNVVFAARIGDLNVRQTFSLKAMSYMGRPEM